MDDKTKKIAGAVIGIALIGILLWYFLFSNKPAISKPTMPIVAPPATQPTPTQGGGQIYSGGGQVQTTYNDPNIVGREGYYSASVKNLQKHLMTAWKKDLGSFKDDGFLGNYTYTAIEQIAPNTGKNIRAKQAISKSEYDMLIAYFPSSTGSSPNPSPTPASLDYNSKSSLMKWISENTAANNPERANLNNWTTGGLAEWAKAIQAKKDYFYCSQCWSKKNYFTYRK